jgi:hypothetical protein
MAIFYGVDISNWVGFGQLDLDPSGKLVTGNQLLAQNLLARLFNRKGSYLQSPNFGIDLAGYQNVSDKDIRPGAIAAQIKLELSKDERVSSINVQVTYANNVLKIIIIVTPNETGPFSLVMTLNQAAVSPNFEVVFLEAA